MGADFIGDAFHVESVNKIGHNVPINDSTDPIQINFRARLA
jgi:hypothetical protein